MHSRKSGTSANIISASEPIGSSIRKKQLAEKRNQSETYAPPNRIAAALRAWWGDVVNTTTLGETSGI